MNAFTPGTEVVSYAAALTPWDAMPIGHVTGDRLAFSDATNQLSTMPCDDMVPVRWQGEGFATWEFIEDLRDADQTAATQEDATA